VFCVKDKFNMIDPETIQLILLWVVLQGSGSYLVVSSSRNHVAIYGLGYNLCGKVLPCIG
jgi:hypothetical protein